MDKVRQWFSSIRVSLMMCVIVTLLAAQGLYLVSLSAVDNAMLDLIDPRPDSILFERGSYITVNYGGKGTGSDTQVTNEPLFGTLKNLRSLLPVIIYGALVIVAILLYYRIKLRRPLALLEQGIKKIADKELDFNIESPSSDELGRLCGAFEHMRAELRQTFQDLWQSEENQRSLYRAFAHDLRTPLTIIKGNNEIIELVAAKNRDWDKAIDAVALSNSAIERIEQYAEQLKEMESLDDWQPTPVDCNLEELSGTVTQQAEVLAREYGKGIAVTVKGGGSVRLDRNGVMRVLDNLLTNALQYAANAINVQIQREGSNLIFEIIDDGPGFSPMALKRATTPFWTSNKTGGHMGVGLTISANIIEKVGGSIQMGNNQDQGANVKIILPV